MSGEQKFYVDKDGRLIGSFDGAGPGYGEVVPSWPGDTRQRWDFTNKVWLPLPFDKVAFDASVTAERDRRIAAGFVFNGRRYQSRATDRENIMGNAILAFQAVAGGAGAGNLRWASEKSDFSWIAEDNSLVPMDAPTMVQFANTAAAHKATLIFRAREIKDLVPPPEDVTADKWW